MVTNSQAEIVANLEEYFDLKGNELGIRAASLFGSVASNRHTPDSDVDVGILMPENYTLEHIENLYNDLVDLLGREVDVIVLNDTNPSLASEAVRGKKLFGDERTALEFTLQADREAEDWSRFIKSLYRQRMVLRGQLT